MTTIGDLRPHPLRQVAASRAVSRTITTARGTTAAIELQPDAPVAVALLVPGYTGSKEDFVAILEPLAALGYYAVAIDQRGQYESPGVADPAAYTVAELGADLLAMAGAICEGPIHLVGHSFGGLVSRQAVIAAPTAFASLTLMSSGPSGLVGPRAEALKYATPLLEQLGHEGLYEATLALARAEADYLEPPAELVAFLRTRFLRTDPASLLGMGAAMLGESDRVEELRATGVPVLVAYSERDNAWPSTSQSEMAERLRATRVVVADAEHSPALENPAATVAALMAFWAAHPAG